MAKNPNIKEWELKGSDPEKGCMIHPRIALWCKKPSRVEVHLANGWSFYTSTHNTTQSFVEENDAVHAVMKTHPCQCKDCKKARR